MFRRFASLVLCFVGLVGSTTIVGARSALEDSTDLKIHNTSNVDARGAENTVYVHPTDSRIVLVSQNNSVVQGINAWVSQDGGKTWSGDNSAAGGTSNGDPAAVIRRAIESDPVRYIVGTLANKDVGPPNLDAAQQIVYKDSPTSLTWTRVTVVNNTQGLTDKNHLWVDNHPSSSNLGFLYAGWSNVDTKRTEAAVSVDGGLNWIRRANLDLNATRAEWGVNLQVAIDASHRGEIYAVWAETDATPADHARKHYFNKSSDAGVNWGTATEVYTLGNMGYERRDQSLSGKDMGTNSAPTMTVDDSGNIYMVWTQKRADGSSGDAEVYMLKSSNQGSTWTALGSSPKRVNQDSGTSDQWQSWVTWDDCTNAVVVVYFDSRADNTKADTYIAASYDGGSTFQEVKVNGVTWSGDNNGGFAGDYIGIAARDGIAYPVWSDDHETTGVFTAYISPIYLWGVTQSSVAHSVVSNPGLSLTVTATWNTNLSATGTDYLVLTSPTNVSYTGTATGSGTSHSVAKTCTCEPGDWNYIVKSTRPGFTSRGSDEKTIRITACVD